MNEIAANTGTEGPLPATSVFRPRCQDEDLATQYLRGEWSGATSPAAPRQAPGLEPVETAGCPKGGRGNGQQPELRGEGRAEAVTGDW